MMGGFVMKNEYNDKNEELVRDTVNSIISNDVLLPTDILRILVGDFEYIKMLESGLLSHIIYLLDYIGRDVWMTKCINIYAKRGVLIKGYIHHIVKSCML